MGRLRDLLDELHARQAATVLADDTLARDGWDSEGGGMPLRDDEARSVDDAL